MFKSYGKLGKISKNELHCTYQVFLLSFEAAIPLQNTTCRFWQWADEAVLVVRDIAMQITALQEESRGVVAFRAVARPSDQPTQNVENRLQILDERMERVEKMLRKLVNIVSFAVFLLLYVVLAK